MQAFSTLLPPTQNAIDNDRGDDTGAALGQFEHAIALIRAATGESLMTAGVSKWLRDVGHVDLSNMLRSATRHRNGLAHPTDIQVIDDFVASWVAANIVGGAVTDSAAETLGAAREAHTISEAVHPPSDDRQDRWPNRRELQWRPESSLTTGSCDAARRR